jgi:hypothetical protein
MHAKSGFRCSPSKQESALSESGERCGNVHRGSALIRPLEATSSAKIKASFSQSQLHAKPVLMPSFARLRPLARRPCVGDVT